MPLMESSFSKRSNSELLTGATTGPVKVIEVILPLLKGNVLDNSPAPTVRFPSASKVTGQVPQTPCRKPELATLAFSRLSTDVVLGVSSFFSVLGWGDTFCLISLSMVLKFAVSGKF